MTSQDIHVSRQKQLEDNSAALRTSIEEAVGVVKASNFEARCKDVCVRTYPTHNLMV